MRSIPASAVLAVTLATALPVSGQGPVDTRFSLPAPPAPEVLRTPTGAALASLALPGAGQAALGARRWAAYALIEVAAWAVRLNAIGERRDATNGYRDVAWTVAREPLHSLPRQDGSWGYYETMSHYVSSGGYDLDAGPGFQPETDESTYNGYVWGLARSIYLPSGVGGPGTAGYDDAVAYYEGHAAGPAFLWSWQDHPEDLDRFRSLIDEADDAARTARAALGAVLANHLVSAVDALITARGIAGGGVHLESRIMVEPVPAWELGLRLPMP
jgi:hypothetical protein